MKSNVSRIVATLGLVCLWGWFNFAVNASAPLISGQTAVAQLSDSNESYFVSKMGTVFNGDARSSFILVFALMLVWLKPAIRLLKGSGGSATMLLAFGMVGIGTSCHGYYDAKDEVEYVQIKANQTAFLVPQQGKNLEGQAAFDSAVYLDSAKIAEKRIQIPHQVLVKKGWTATNMYIPSAVLYVVTREPYSRMWVKEATRGTSIKDEGMYLESAEGINIDFGVSTGAHIQIKDAALYLFNFGTSQVLNQGDNSDYPSVVYARPLADVMDTIVYQRIHTLLAREFGKRKFDDARLQKIECMEAAEKQAIEEFAKVGITIEYVGYASQLNFDPKIQEAINKVFIANQEAEAAESQMKAMPARLALADISIREGVGKAAEKWDGRIALPNFMLLSPGVLDAFKGLFNSPAPVVTPAAGIQK